MVLALLVGRLVGQVVSSLLSTYIEYGLEPETQNKIRKI
jgi:hypothetical protein